MSHLVKVLGLITLFTSIILIIISFLPHPLVIIKTDKDIYQVNEKINAKGLILNLGPQIRAKHAGCEPPYFQLNNDSYESFNIRPCNPEANYYNYYPFKTVTIEKTLIISTPGTYTLSLEGLKEKKTIQVVE